MQLVADTAIVVRFPAHDNSTTNVGNLYLPNASAKKTPCPDVICYLGLGLTQTSQIPLP